MSDRVGVLGATGYVGGAVTADLQANGYDVSPAAGSPHERYPTVDVSDRDAVSTFVEDVDYVVNAAGIVGTDACADRPASAFEVNGTGAATVAWACRRQAVPLVHCSSVATIGQPDSQPITADSRRNPTTTYGETKLLGERAVRTITDGSLPSITYCLTNVYGTHEPSQDASALDAGSSSVVDFFLERAATDGLLPVHRPGTQTRDLIHVSDVARAVRIAIDEIESLDPAARSYVVGSGNAYSVLEIAGLVAAQCRRRTGWSPAIELRDRPNPDQPVIDRYDVDTEPLATAFGIVPERDVRGWIEAQIERYDLEKCHHQNSNGCGTI